MYIPMSIPPVLPQSMGLDRSSQWHVSALLSAALETMTLPSRLRYTSRNHVTFDAMEAALNVNGTQRIANLQCSVVDPSVLKVEKSRSVKRSHDGRMPGSTTNDPMLDEDDAQVTTAHLDMDFFCGGHVKSLTSLSQRQEGSHTFGQVESLRGDFPMNEEEDEEELGLARKRRRLAHLPVVEKSVSNTWKAHWLLVTPSMSHRRCMYFQYLCSANHRTL